MRLLIPGCSFLLLTLLVDGCRRHDASAECPHDAGMRTYEQWRESVKFPYVASQIRKGQIVKNFDRVGVGSTKQDFVAALGEPDFEEEMYPKELNRPCIGYVLTYYLEKPEDMVNEIRDKKIEAFFSPAGKAHWITTNISGLTEKGSPRRN